jgi:hypothetical protein
MRSALEGIFPGLQQSDYDITSNEDGNYNCIAWAANDATRLWWPGVYYWPKASPFSESISLFAETFCDNLGFEVCENGDLEEGYQKLAIYADAGKVKHMARQLPDGKWTSKLGQSFDIIHILSGIEGTDYGKVVLFLRKKAEAT